MQMMISLYQVIYLHKFITETFLSDEVYTVIFLFLYQLLEIS